PGSRDGWAGAPSAGRTSWTRPEARCRPPPRARRRWRRARSSARASRGRSLPQLLSDPGDGSLNLALDDLLAFLAGSGARICLRRNGVVVGGGSVEGGSLDDSVLCVPDRGPRGRKPVEPYVLARDREHDRRLLAGRVPGILVGRGRWNPDHQADDGHLAPARLLAGDALQRPRVVRRPVSVDQDDEAEGVASEQPHDLADGDPEGALLE